MTKHKRIRATEAFSAWASITKLICRGNKEICFYNFLRILTSLLTWQLDPFYKKKTEEEGFFVFFFFFDVCVYVCVCVCTRTCVCLTEILNTDVSHLGILPVYL